MRHPTGTPRAGRAPAKKRAKGDDRCASAADATGGGVLASETSREIRCAGCGSLLAKLAEGALHLRRGDLQASFDGDFHGSIICYRARCRRLNVVRVSSSERGEGKMEPEG